MTWIRHTLTLLALACAGLATADQVQLFGVNLSGAEFGDGYELNYGTDYVYPSPEFLNYYHSRGLKLIRLPFKWERVQYDLNGPLDTDELARMDYFLDQADARGMMVILDMHNYASRIVFGEDSDPSTPTPNGFKIGEPELPISAYKDVWKRLAAHFKDRDNIWAYGLMNEPKNIATNTWFTAAQAAVDGIREEDMSNYVLLPGTYYSNAHRWPNHGEYLIDIEDPADKRIFEAHSYWDPGHDGKYQRSFASTGFGTDYGVNDLTAFVEWCNANDVQGFIGEFGVPWDYPDWAPVLENALDYMRDNGISATYWAGGPWWGDGYELTVDVDSRNNAPRYSLGILQNYGDGLSPYGRDVTWYHDTIASGLLYAYPYEYGGNGATVTVDSQSTDTDLAGSRSFKVSYTLPSGGNANCGMHIEEGIYLKDNFTAPGSKLTLYVRGDAGSLFQLRMVDANGVSGASLLLTDYGPPIDDDWYKYEIPMTDFLDADMNGDAHIERLRLDLLNADNVPRTFYIDEVKIDAPTYIPDGGGAPATLLAEDFGDGALTGWSTAGGNWSVQSGELKQNNNNPDALAWWNDAAASDWTDYTVAADVRSTDNDHIGLAFCVQDSLNHYLLTMSKQEGVYRLDLVENGSVYTLATAGGTYTTGTDYRLEVELDNGAITARRDGAVVLTHADTTFTSGSVGLYAHYCEDAFFDDVDVFGLDGESTTVALGAVNDGIAATDGATGTGFVMWSEQNVFDRFDPDPYNGNSSNLITVFWDGGQWKVDLNSTRIPFTPVASDVLIAEVDYTNDTIASLEGVDDTYEGMARGYVSGDLTFLANLFDGSSNDGEFTVRGSFFTKNGDADEPAEGDTVSLGAINKGVAARDSATGAGFILWSALNVVDRFDPDPYDGNSSNLIAVVWDGSQWLVDNNSTLSPFTPVASDVLIAEVDFSNDTITSLEGVDDTYNGIARGYISGDLSFVADIWDGGSNDGEFTVSGSVFTKN